MHYWNLGTHGALKSIESINQLSPQKGALTSSYFQYYSGSYVHQVNGMCAHITGQISYLNKLISFVIIFHGCKEMLTLRLEVMPDRINEESKGVVFLIPSASVVLPI